MDRNDERHERIAAYLDGDMTGGDAADFEAAMAQDPVLAAQVARWRDNDALLRDAFAAPVAAGVDAALLARMGLAGPDMGADDAAGDTADAGKVAGGAQIVDLAAVRRQRADAAKGAVGKGQGRRTGRWTWPLGAALAATLIALIALPVELPVGKAPALADNPRFLAAMENSPSRSISALGGNADVRPVLSFAADDGRYCREFLVSDTDGGMGGIACRGKGGWTIEALARNGAPLTGGGGIEMASGLDPQALDAAYDRLGASDPIGRQAEKALIANDWRAK